MNIMVSLKNNKIYQLKCSFQCSYFRSCSPVLVLYDQNDYHSSTSDLHNAERSEMSLGEVRDYSAWI